MERLTNTLLSITQRGKLGPSNFRSLLIFSPLVSDWRAFLVYNALMNGVIQQNKEFAMELEDKQKNMLEKFAWNDDYEKTVRLEGDGFAKDVDECAEFIVQSFLTSINSQHYNGEEIVVPIDSKVHHLIGTMFGDDINEVSQSQVFIVLQQLFFAKIWQDKSMVVDKINMLVLPVDAGHKQRYTVDNIWLHDNLEDDDCPIVDITTDADANKNLNDLMGLGLSADHVREEASIQGRDEVGSLLQVEVTLAQEPNPDYDPEYKSGRSIEEGNIALTDKGAVFTEDKEGHGPTFVV